MTSIYQRAMGGEFQNLHPEVRKRFGFSSADGIASIGRGEMEEIWRRIMFPERGAKVPFTIENYAYRDGFGRETVTWVRKFRGARPRRFDAYMVYSDSRRCVVDYLGTHQHLAVDLSISVGPDGGICIRSGEQRFYEGFLGFRFPLLFSGTAEVREWFDDDIGRFRISVTVTNRAWGRLFGYRGAFDAESVETGGRIPDDLMPRREERRE
ncbi:MAG TPA: DUF4166 domain-containing protein [Thermoanaerobaculia bacterium]|nr:DUF4166 domain-containing protein [Thermoanaerobaculia bacterium]